MRVRALLQRILTDNSGATAVEYALVAGIMLIVVVSIAGTGGALSSVYDKVGTIVGYLQ
jgi:pilus assembly protein Flp/PilA